MDSVGFVGSSLVGSDARAVQRAVRGRRSVVCVVSTPERDAVAVKRAKPRGPAPVLHTEGDMLEETPQMIATVLAVGAVAGLEVASIAAGVGGPVAGLTVALGFLAGYYFADFGSGVYHWSLDNYGTKDTPIFGYQIDAFQGHHKSPWTITKRGFFNNVSRPAAVGLPLFALLLAAPLPLGVESFLCSTLIMSVLAQEFHKWSHTVQPAPAVKWLMNQGLLISTKVHGRHHHDPFEGNYCIVNGKCNAFLDRTKFFRKAEALVFRLTGNTPICWDLDPSLRDDALGPAKVDRM